MGERKELTGREEKRADARNHVVWCNYVSRLLMVEV